MFPIAKDKAKAESGGQRMLFSTDTKVPFKGKAPTVLFMVSFTIDTLPPRERMPRGEWSATGKFLNLVWASVSHLWKEDDNVVSFVGFGARTGSVLSELLILWLSIRIQSVPESLLPVILSTTTSSHLKPFSLVLSSKLYCSLPFLL